MCGIVGLFAKSPEIEEQLGAHLVAMLAQMSDRGPGQRRRCRLPRSRAGRVAKLTLYSPDPARTGRRSRALAAAFGGVDPVRASHAVVVVAGRRRRGRGAGTSVHRRISG